MKAHSFTPKHPEKYLHLFYLANSFVQRNIQVRQITHHEHTGSQVVD